MTDNEPKPSDHVYWGINSLNGWDEALSTAHGWGGNRARSVGRLISGILVAGGEDRMPVAMAGQLDDNGTGNLAVLYPNVIVTAAAASILSDNAETTITVHPLTVVGSLDIKAAHSYYDGTSRSGRHTQLEVSITIDGAEFTFAGRSYNSSQLTDDNSVKAALETLREYLAR